MNRQEIVEELKNALAHLNDVAMLSDSPLAEVIVAAPTPGVGVVSRGVHLRGLLMELIESLHPSAEVPDNTPEWRQYLILRERYVLRRPLWEIEQKLVVGERQMRREHSHGLAILAEMLHARFIAAGVRESGVAAASTAEDTRAIGLAAPAATPAQAIQRLTPVSRVVGLAQLIEEVISFLVMVGKLTSEQAQARLHITPAGLTVSTDPGVLRQLLTQLLLTLAPRFAPGSTVSLQAAGADDGIAVSLSVEAAPINPADESMQLCQLLARVLGTALQFSIQGVDGLIATQTICFTLPSGIRLRKLLVIDDELAAVDLYQTYAIGMNYEVFGETNPEEAIDRALEIKPDVIMLDVMMPAMDGWELLQRFRHTRELRDVPVIVCSVLAESDMATALRAAAFLKKPILRSQFVKTLNQVSP